MGDAAKDRSVAEVNSGLIRRTPGITGTTCPYCGKDDVDRKFFAPEDIEAAKKDVAWAFREDVGDMLDGFADKMNLVPGNRFLTITASVTRPPNPRPHHWRQDLLRGLTCDLCQRDYGVYAIALFCPDCGGRNVHVHFRREVELVSSQVSLSAEIEKRGDIELGYRLLGNAHEDVLTALETYLKSIFLLLARRRKTDEEFARLAVKARKGNPFQSRERATSLYGRIGVDPFRLLPQADLEFLDLHIQKRHVIGHNLGVVDEKYLETSEAEGEGETVQVLGAEVMRFADIAFRVVTQGLEESEPEFRPPQP